MSSRRKHGYVEVFTDAQGTRYLLMKCPLPLIKRTMFLLTTLNPLSIRFKVSKDGTS
jgi:hypothetical protein